MNPPTKKRKKEKKKEKKFWNANRNTYTAGSNVFPRIFLIIIHNGR
jgi:hypothetical protein